METVTPHPSTEPIPFSLPSPQGLGFDVPVNLQESLPNLANAGLDFALLIAGILAVFYVIYAGLLYITSAGDPNRVKAARSTLLNVVIGIVVLLSTFFLIRMAVSIGLEIGSFN